VIWAPGGLGAAEVYALSSILELRFHGGDGLGALETSSAAPGTPGRRPTVGVTLEAFGDLEDLDLRGVVGTGSRWRSVTPFLPTRHPHPGRQSAQEFLHDGVGRELRHRGIETSFTVGPGPGAAWGAFRRHRRSEHLGQARAGYGLTIELQGRSGAMAPSILALGQLSHFGMGRFEPCP
jgi:hypothetical protein